jgi:hypothetical protein
VDLHLYVPRSRSREQAAGQPTNQDSECRVFDVPPSAAGRRHRRIMFRHLLTRIVGEPGKQNVHPQSPSIVCLRAARSVAVFVVVALAAQFDQWLILRALGPNPVPITTLRNGPPGKVLDFPNLSSCSAFETRLPGKFIDIRSQIG